MVEFVDHDVIEVPAIKALEVTARPRVCTEAHSTSTSRSRT